MLQKRTSWATTTESNGGSFVQVEALDVVVAIGTIGVEILLVATALDREAFGGGVGNILSQGTSDEGCESDKEKTTVHCWW